MESAISSLATPYLSVVVTTRNDHHGGDPLTRLQAFVNTLAAQCAGAALDAELIVVEWNPPLDKPRVRDLIHVPVETPFEVRFVDVPPALHRRFRYADVLPLFQMIAKNVGIRRARGRFVLATNIDVIFSTDLVRWLATEPLERGRLYRVDRRDIESDYPIDGALDAQMAYCRTHQLRVHTRMGTYPVDSDGRPRSMEPDIIGVGVTLADGWYPREDGGECGFYRWTLPEARFAVDRTATADVDHAAALDIEIEPNPYQPSAWAEVEIVEGPRTLMRERVSSRKRLRVVLDERVTAHDMALRVVDSSGGREHLSLLDARDPLACRVWHIGLSPLSAYEYGMDGWQRANENPLLRVDRTSGGLAITTDPAGYSYCVRYGPFEAPADGDYEFLLEYVAIDGRLALSIMDDERGVWLHSKVVELRGAGGEILSVVTALAGGAKFSLYISNNRPEGGVSRFVVRRLLGSVAREALGHAVRVNAARAGRIATVASRLITWPPHRRAGARAASEPRHAKGIDPTAQRQEPVSTPLTQLDDLAPLIKLLRQQRVALHQNACGDFQLMAHEHWRELRGYPELEMFSMGIDSVLEAVAHAAGIREEVLQAPLCVYHLEHEKGSGWTPEGEEQLRKRIAESGITWLDVTAIRVWTSYMLWLRRPMIFNGDDWGLRDEVLPERTIAAARLRAGWTG